MLLFGLGSHLIIECCLFANKRYYFVDKIKLFSGKYLRRDWCGWTSANYSNVKNIN